MIAVEAPQAAPVQAEFTPAFVPDAKPAPLLPVPEMSDFHEDVHEEANYTQDWKSARAAKGESTDSHIERKTIERDSRVSSNVSVGEYDAEAIVVDNAPRPDGTGEVNLAAYEGLLAEVNAKLAAVSPENDRPTDLQTIQAIYETVMSAMPYSAEGVKQIQAEAAKILKKDKLPKGTKIGLSWFISSKTGVCRHQGLAVAALAEMIKDKGQLSGEISFDRNINWVDPANPSGHAWTRYTDTKGEVYVVDVAGKYFGKLVDTIDQSKWSYFRSPEEKTKFRDMKAAREAVAFSRADDDTIPRDQLQALRRAKQTTQSKPGLIDHVPTHEELTGQKSSENLDRTADLEEEAKLVQSSLDGITTDLRTSDQYNLLRFYEGRLDSNRALRRGDYVAQREADRDATDAERALSKIARERVGRYFELRNQQLSLERRKQ